MNTATSTYAIRVDGHLDDHWSAWLGELDMSRNDDGTTTITASIADQAQLHGVLAGLRDIGAVIIELRTTGAPVSTAKPSQTSACSSPRLTAAALYKFATGARHRTGDRPRGSQASGSTSELAKRPGTR